MSLLEINSRFLWITVLLGLLAISSSGSAKGAESKNGSGLAHQKLQLYFSHGDLTLETRSQCNALKETFSDLLENRPEPFFSKKQYPNYQGVENQWNVFEVLEHYIASDNKYPLPKETFFKEIRSSPVHKELRTKLKILGDCLDHAGD